MCAILTSASLTSPTSTEKSGVRTSSGHIMVWSTMTSPASVSRTRSTAIVVRWRSATVTTAIRSASFSAWRRSA